MLRLTIKSLSLTNISDKFRRLLSSTANELLIEKPKKQKREKYLDPTIQKDLYKHFNQINRQNALEYPPEILAKTKKKTIDGFYIADSHGADMVFEAVTKNLSSEKPLLEVNPGLGMLTKRLLAETENKLLLCEPDKFCFDKITKLSAKYPEREVYLKNSNYIALWKLEFLDKFDQGSRVNELFKHLKRTPYYEDTVLRVFACVGSHLFFRDLINSIAFQNSFMTPGRTEFVLCVPPSIYLQLTCAPSAGYLFYRQISVLFQILFEYEFITKINRKCFLPWVVSSPSTRKEKITKLDDEYMFVVRLIPRKNIFQYCLPSHLRALWFFVKQNLRSRSKAVIPAMESWIPGCGLRLIVNAKPQKKPSRLFPDEDTSILPDFYAPCQSLSINDYVDNVHVFTQFGTLTPMQIFTIFDQFIHWPEYESSAFGAELLEKHLEKIYSSPDENAHEIESDDEGNEESEKNR